MGMGGINEDVERDTLEDALENGTEEGSSRFSSLKTCSTLAVSLLRGRYLESVVFC